MTVIGSNFHSRCSESNDDSAVVKEGFVGSDTEDPQF